MTQDQYDKSIITGELQLDAWGKFSYFSIVGFLFFIPSMVLTFDLFDNSTNFVSPPIWVIIIPTVLGVLLYRLQKSRLKFQIVKTKLGKQELLKVLKQAGYELKWTVIFEEEDIFVAKTDPGYFSSNLGEQVTVLFNHDLVLINCVCVLDRKSSFDLTGHNKKTTNSLVDRINEAEKDKIQ